MDRSCQRGVALAMHVCLWRGLFNWDLISGHVPAHLRMHTIFTDFNIFSFIPVLLGISTHKTCLRPNTAYFT